MNNYQNSNYKYYFPKTTVPGYTTKTYPSYEEGKEKKKDSKNDLEVNTGALKIFVDSDHSAVKQWNLKYATTYREVNSPTKTKATGEVKEKKDVERKHRKETPIKEKYKQKDESKQETKENEKVEKVNKEPEKITTKRSLKSVLLNQGFYSYDKSISEKEKKLSEKPESLSAVISAKLSRTGFKMEGKSSKISGGPTTTPAITDSKKFHINEILKSHAQKLQLIPSKSSQKIKDYSFQGVSELLHKIKSNPKPKNETVDEIKKPNQTKPEKVETASKTQEKVEEAITKAPSKETENKTVEPEKVKEVVSDQGTIKVRKKLLTKWISSPQSNELERRLKGSGQVPEDLFPSNNETKQEKEKSEENNEKKNKKGESPSDKVKEDDKKRTTYTDRLLIGRTADKAKDSTESSDLKKPTDIHMKKIENVGFLYQIPSKIDMSEPLKDVTASATSDPVPLKVERRNQEESEGLFKTKLSRSTELRDLVIQAVKEHKIFCIFDNHWYIVRPVREELLSRGWLEVIPDRRFIPRRRPPPSGPTYEREKSFVERNCNTIEAILAARETFADELQETVSKCGRSFGDTIDKSKYFSMGAPVTPVKKFSDESVSDVPSHFQIVPPTPEKKKTNLEIREFLNKYKSLWDRDKKGTVEDKYGQKVKGSKDATSNGPKRPENNLQALDSKNDGKSDKKEEEKSLKITYSENDAKAVSKIIQSLNARIHFMWLSIKPAIHLKCFNYSPEIVNKFQKTTFCTKIGLWNHLNNIQWYAHEVRHPAKSPRMYNTGEADDLQAFFQDFQMTACLGLLKWLVDTFFNRGIKAVQNKKGKVPLKAFDFAIKQCEKYIRFKDNEELNIIEEQKVLQEEWNTFLQWFYTITNDHGKVQECSSAQLMVVYTKAVETLKSMRRYWPEIDTDGRLNIWIMKPYCASCGRGIFMTNNVYYIGQHSKYIVQKYIEKPLLIYNTKFDIRQWFMVTKLTPLEIWMYKECYLRFCTQPFALRNLHESVHLSNNSVQRKYISYRDPGLPDQNMWDSNTFQLYLKTIGHPTAWEDIIYPGMRDAIVSIMLAAQDTFDGPRRNWFEVYGADFMLSANVRDGPWLIEINENPAMDPSTKVTARLCPQMLRDVIKVVVDKRANKNASTGQWELIYRQNYSPSFGTVDLDVKGKKISRVPPVTKLGLNINHQTTAYSNVRKYYDDIDAKLYDLVKSYDKHKQNAEGEVNNYVSSIVEKFSGREQVKNSENVGAVSKERVALNRQTFLLVDQAKKPRETGDKRKETFFGKPQTFGNVLESAELFISDSDYPEKSSKGEKNLVTLISSLHRKRLKRMRNCFSSSRKFSKDINPEKDSNETNKSSAPHNCELRGTKDRESYPLLNQLKCDTKRFSFSKFY